MITILFILLAVSNMFIRTLSVKEIFWGAVFLGLLDLITFCFGAMIGISKRGGKKE
jgi:hypothetical protein